MGSSDSQYTARATNGISGPSGSPSTTSLPVFSTGDGGWIDSIREQDSVLKSEAERKTARKPKTNQITNQIPNGFSTSPSPHQSVQQQGDFVGLLLEAAQLIDEDHVSNHGESSSGLLPANQTVDHIQNVNELLSIYILWHFHTYIEWEYLIISAICPINHVRNKCFN